MAFTQQLPEWNAPGVEPSATQKQTGFQPGMKPPAQWFNWHLNWSYLALKELQEKAAEKTYVDTEFETIKNDITQLQEDVQNADIPDASLTEKGKTQLSSATDSELEDRASTPKAVKSAYDRGSAGVTAAGTAQARADSAYTEATAAKQLGVEQKNNVVAALNSIGVSASTSETWTQLITKMSAVVRATGNATPAQVLAGATFSNASANGLVGTYVGAQLIGGVGTLITGDTTSDPNDIYTWSTTPFKKLEATIFQPGTYRVTFTLGGPYGSSTPVYGRIYVNDVARGITRTSTAGYPSVTTFIEDITVKANDKISLYLWTSNASKQAICISMTVYVNFIATGFNRFMG
ncbi:tail fiber protein [Paenibacillus sp. DCT19]|uniref:tail fiber protein n=1 Tax=Paenibacillus sp. DCT19 TaxID=2211212 RepID=UPI000FE1F79E|nr:phage tail protein [Paenibacillus sp. DCT19]